MATVVRPEHATMIKEAVAKAVRETLARIEGDTQRASLREAEQLRLKEERRQGKAMRQQDVRLFEAEGMDRKSAKKAAKLLDSDAYRRRMGF